MADNNTEAGKDKIDQMFDEMEAEEQQFAQKNQKFRKRLVFLLPYNLALIWGSIKYAKNINKISKRLWPSR